MTARPRDTAPERIAMPTETGEAWLAVADILCIEAADNFTYFFMKDGQKLVFAKTVGRVEEMLEGCGFCRPHRSHLVNRAAVRAYFPRGEDPHLELFNGYRVPVSRRWRTMVAEFFPQNDTGLGA